MGEESSGSVGRIKVKFHIFQSTNNPRNATQVKRTGSKQTAPVVAAEVGNDVFVLALLHHRDLLLDGCDVITWADREVSECFLSQQSDLLQLEEKLYTSKPQGKSSGSTGM